MKIDDHEIPPAVLLAWCGALARLPEAKVRSLATEQGLGAGFRPNKMAPDVARARLRSALESYSELPEQVRLALRQSSQASALTVSLSDELVLEQCDRLARSLGFAETMAALLLDGRSSLRKRALEKLAAWDGSEPGEAERRSASDELAAVFLSLSQALQPLIQRHPPGAPADSPPASPLATRAPRQQSERQLVIALRDKRREAGRLSRELAACSHETERWRAELDRLRPALELAGQRAVRAESELADLRRDFDSQVLERLQALLDERLLPWLAPAQALAQVR